MSAGPYHPSPHQAMSHVQGPLRKVSLLITRGIGQAEMSLHLPWALSESDAPIYCSQPATSPRINLRAWGVGEHRGRSILCQDFLLWVIINPHFELNFLLLVTSSILIDEIHFPQRTLCYSQLYGTFLPTSVLYGLIFLPEDRYFILFILYS